MRTIELRRVAPFATMAPAELVAIAAVARLYNYRHGARLFRAGDAVTSVTIVLDGFVRLSRATPHGEEVTTAIVRPGGLAAVAALRGRATHDDAAEAIGRVRTVELPALTLLGLACRSPRLFAELAQCLVARVDDAYLGAATDSEGQLPSRVLHTLRHLARPIPAASAADAMCPLAVRLSHAEVARLVGADRSTVTRLLRSLAERGLVRRERGHVIGVVLSADEKSAREEPGRRMIPV